MKRVLSIVSLAVLLLAAACTKNGMGVQLYSVDVQLIYPENSAATAREDVEVVLTGSADKSSFSSKTDARGLASFQVPAGTYIATASDTVKTAGVLYLLNGTANEVIASDEVKEPYMIELAQSKTSQVIIKEIYVGGCPKDEGTGAFASDKYMILYNNSDADASLKNVCIAMAFPLESTKSTNYDYVDGKLFYADDEKIPASQAYWEFSNDIVLKPGEQVVVAFNGAIDNTKTYSKSVDLSNSSYYVTYDAEMLTNATLHPAPAETIPTSHYLKAYNYGPGGYWTVNNTSPALYLFVPQDGATAASFLADASNVNYYQNKTTTAANIRKMVPTSWVVDAIEVFLNGKTTNKKRLLPSVDNGSVNFINGLGYSIYRNVDEKATKAIEGNEAKLVYNYTGTASVDGGSTDPTGIDAEASIKNGARIVYMDSNDSSKDFHMRAAASIR